MIEIPVMKELNLERREQRELNQMCFYYIYREQWM